MVNSINAETEMKYNEIMAEAKLVEVKIIEDAQAQAAEIIANADAYKAETVAKAMQEAGPMNAKAVELMGTAESVLAKSFKQRREHDQLMAKIDSVKAATQNKNSVIFGDQQKNLMAQVVAFDIAKKQYEHK